MRSKVACPGLLLGRTLQDRRPLACAGRGWPGPFAVSGLPARGPAGGGTALRNLTRPRRPWRGPVAHERSSMPPPLEGRPEGRPAPVLPAGACDERAHDSAVFVTLTLAAG